MGITDTFKPMITLDIRVQALPIYLPLVSVVVAYGHL